MKDKDFRQLVDHELAQLTWSDQQRLDTLQKMQKEARPVMKRKLSVAIIAVALLLTLTGTAVAAGLNITTLQEFFDMFHASNVDGVGIPAQVKDAAVVTPRSYRHTSQLLDITVDQVYLTEESLFLTVHYSPKNPNARLFDWYHKTIIHNGEEKKYWQLWDEELTLLLVNGLRRVDLNGIEDADGFDLIHATRDPETGAVTFMYAFKHPELLSEIRSCGAHTLMFRFEVNDLATHDLEWNALFIDLPRMEVVHSNNN